MKKYAIIPLYQHIQVRNKVVYANNTYDLIEQMYPLCSVQEEEIQKLEEELSTYGATNYHDFYICVEELK